MCKIEPKRPIFHKRQVMNEQTVLAKRSDFGNNPAFLAFEKKTKHLNAAHLTFSLLIFRFTTVRCMLKSHIFYCVMSPSECIFCQNSHQIRIPHSRLSLVKKL